MAFIVTQMLNQITASNSRQISKRSAGYSDELINASRYPVYDVPDNPEKKKWWRRKDKND